MKIFFCLLINLFLVNLAFAEEGLRDIKPPVYFPANYFFLTLLGVLIVLAGLIFLVFYLLKRFKRKRLESASPRKLAHEVAYERLKSLKAKNLPAQGMTKTYYTELSDIVRHYIENRFNVRAPEMTTEEFLASLRYSGELSGAQKNLLKEFLNRCDMVKFAKYGPTQKEIDDSFNAAERFVDETKETLNSEEAKS